MARTNQIDVRDESPVIETRWNTWVAELVVTHHGLTLDSANVTPAALTYFVSMGMAQSFLDVGSVNYSNIAGVDSKGATPAGAWDIAKCRKHAARLGLTSFDGSVESRKTLAETWIKDARDNKWQRILSGELVHDGESRGPRLDPVESFVWDQVSNIILTACRKANDSRAKKDKVDLPKGKALSDMITAYMANEANAAKLTKVRELAALSAALTAE